MTEKAASSCRRAVSYYAKNGGEGESTCKHLASCWPQTLFSARTPLLADLDISGLTRSRRDREIRHKKKMPRFSALMFYLIDFIPLQFNHPRAIQKYDRKSRKLMQTCCFILYAKKGESTCKHLASCWPKTLFSARTPLLADLDISGLDKIETRPRN